MKSEDPDTSLCSSTRYQYHRKVNEQYKVGFNQVHTMSYVHTLMDIHNYCSSYTDVPLADTTIPSLSVSIGPAVGGAVGGVMVLFSGVGMKKGLGWQD